MPNDIAALWPGWLAIAIAVIVSLNQLLSESEKFARLFGRFGRWVYARAKARHRMDLEEFNDAVRDSVADERERPTAARLDGGHGCSRGLEIERDERRAPGRERLGDLTANGTRGAGDDRDLSLELALGHHRVSLPSKFRCFVSVNSYRPSRPCWRPMPERLKPPTSASS